MPRTGRTGAVFPGWMHASASCLGQTGLPSLTQGNIHPLPARGKASPSARCRRVRRSRRHPAEDRAEPSAGIPTGSITGRAGQEGRRNQRTKGPAAQKPLSRGKKPTPNQISIDLRCKCIQAPQGTSGCSQPPNEGSLRVLLLLLPGDHRPPHNRPPLHQARGAWGPPPSRSARRRSGRSLRHRWHRKGNCVPSVPRAGHQGCPPPERCRAGGAQHRLCPKRRGANTQPVGPRSADGTRGHAGMLQPDPPSAGEMSASLGRQEQMPQPCQGRGGSRRGNAHTSLEDLIQRGCRFMMLGSSQIPTATTLS